MCALYLMWFTLECFIYLPTLYTGVIPISPWAFEFFIHLRLTCQVISGLSRWNFYDENICLQFYIQILLKRRNNAWSKTFFITVLLKVSNTYAYFGSNLMMQYYWYYISDEEFLPFKPFQPRVELFPLPNKY